MNKRQLKKYKNLLKKESKLRVEIKKSTPKKAPEVRHVETIFHQCVECNGKGKIENKECPYCLGKGLILECINNLVMQF